MAPATPMALNYQTTANSDLGKSTTNAFKENQSTLGTLASFSKKYMANALTDIYKECKVYNWDGYNASSVSFDTFDCAREFIASIPDGIMLPDISAEADGCITFEWYKSNSKLLSISINHRGSLCFLALIGSERFKGLTENRMTDKLLDYIYQILKEN